MIKRLSSKKKQPSCLTRVVGSGDFNQRYPIDGEKGEYKNEVMLFEEKDGKIHLIN